MFKHPQMYPYGSCHGTFNVTRYYHSMKSGILSPSKNAIALNEKTMGGTK
jgi:hypothetical protein